MVFLNFILSEFFETQGYSTPKWLAFAKRCSNHHIAFDNLLKFMESVWMEMVYAFRISNQSKVEQNFESFCKWIDDGNQTLHFICHIVLPCLGSIFMFREGVRENHHHPVENARKIFRQIRYGWHHTKYMIYDSLNLCSRLLIPQEILD